MDLFKEINIDHWVDEDEKVEAAEIEDIIKKLQDAKGGDMPEHMVMLLKEMFGLGFQAALRHQAKRMELMLNAVKSVIQEANG